MDYWEECVAEAFEDAKIQASDEQVNIVASWIESAHDNYGMAFGHDVATANFHGEKERERQELEKQLAREQNASWCSTCSGEGRVRTYFGTMMSDSDCYKCNGTGKIYD